MNRTKFNKVAMTASVSFALIYFAGVARADTPSRYMAAGDAVSAKPIAGRNTRIKLALSTATIKAALLQARKKGEANSYKTAPTAFIKCNPGTLTANEIKIGINKVWQGARAGVTKISAGKYVAKFEYKGRLIKVFIVENGNGHA